MVRVIPKQLCGTVRTVTLRGVLMVFDNMSNIRKVNRWNPVRNQTSKHVSLNIVCSAMPLTTHEVSAERAHDADPRAHQEVNGTTTTSTWVSHTSTLPRQSRHKKNYVEGTFRRLSQARKNTQNDRYRRARHAVR